MGLYVPRPVRTRLVTYGGLRTGRNRIHLDVWVPKELAQARVDAAIAAGGQLVIDDSAPAWWVLADAEGNEACVSGGSLSR